MALAIPHICLFFPKVVLSEDSESDHVVAQFRQIRGEKDRHRRCVFDALCPVRETSQTLEDMRLDTFDGRVFPIPTESSLTRVVYLRLLGNEVVFGVGNSQAFAPGIVQVSSG